MELPDTICEACGIKFKPTEENQKYCDPTCRKDKINENVKPKLTVMNVWRSGERK